MSAPSPPSNAASPATAPDVVSPPSAAATPVPVAAQSDEKIAYQKPVPGEGIELVKNIDYDNLPEVVPADHQFSQNGSDEKSKLDDPPKMPPRAGVDDAQNVPIEQVQTPPPAFQQYAAPGYQQMVTVPPTNPSMMNLAPPDNATVTPLHLLGDQSDTIDCPFCLRRSATRVQKSSSWLTHIMAVCLFFLTFCGVVAPYMLHWFSHVSHWCQNCNSKVAYRNFGSSSMNALGTPDHLRETSRFPAAPPPAPPTVSHQV